MKLHPNGQRCQQNITKMLYATHFLSAWQFIGANFMKSGETFYRIGAEKADLAQK
ncbi:hypothetical protein [Cellvibrio sp. NN19]|uniref:hypothetical protein n=1 Tax=Cellvibrio chitinivorans TaxID=3102792 RepID=UPI002B40F608|nr:hypothetical protein [Cellvibrio sp. NN19]